LAFYVIPGALGRLSSTMWVAGRAGLILHYVLELAAFALIIWGFVEIGCLRGIEGSNRYGPNPLSRERGPAIRYWFAAPAARCTFPNAPASASAAIR
jgi:hypothetical protein